VSPAPTLISQELFDILKWVVFLCCCVIAVYVAARLIAAVEGLPSTMTDEEKMVLMGLCPKCGDFNLHAGPRGCGSLTFACWTCMMSYNAVFTPGQVIFLKELGEITYEQRCQEYRIQNILGDDAYVYGIEA
jgi:hypothetical protein